METPALNLVVSALQRRPPEERVEMARAVEVMVASPGWDVYSELLAQAIADRRKIVETPPSLPSYEELIGQLASLRGLLAAQQLPLAVAESGRRADEELRRIVAAQEAGQE